MLEMICLGHTFYSISLSYSNHTFDTISSIWPNTYKEAWIEEMWDHSGGEGVWSLRFSRPFNDWEVEEVEEVERLLVIIQGRRLNPLRKIVCCGKRQRMGFSQLNLVIVF